MDSESSAGATVRALEVAITAPLPMGEVPPPAPAPLSKLRNQINLIKFVTRLSFSLCVSFGVMIFVVSKITHTKAPILDSWIMIAAISLESYMLFSCTILECFMLMVKEEPFRSGFAKVIMVSYYVSGILAPLFMIAQVMVLSFKKKDA